MKTLVALFLLSAQFLLAQQRFIVSQNGDAFPIYKGQSAFQVARDHGIVASNAVMTCTDKATFGFSPDKFPPNGGHFGLHNDVIGSWFIVPASGTIDSVFWTVADVCAQDSLLFLRIHNSNVYPGNGPGYNGYPLPSTSTCWGYYENTNDLDNGVAAFPEEASGPWLSTVVDGPNSFPPTGTEIWGFGGFPVLTHGNEVNTVDLGGLGVPTVSAGDKIFINFRINGFHGDPCTGAAGAYTAWQGYVVTDPILSQNWKFYEHVVDFQPGYSCKGWVARGGYHLSIWYTMTVTSNVPPLFLSIDELNSTFDTSPRTFNVEIEDCNLDNPDSAGVKTAYISYSVNGTEQLPIDLQYLGGTTWEGTIPGQPAGSTVSYKLVAIDSANLGDSTAAREYRVLSLGNEWYSVDTSIACVKQDIRLTGTQIPNSAFFVPAYPGSGTAPTDDGTAGPFDMGSNFVVFGDTFRYAWVGVNGAIALTKSATDTNDVNSNGFANTFWDFPYDQHHGRFDTAGANNMSPMILAPFWADHIVEDSTGMFGRILYGDNGNPCQFIVEWDSAGAFDQDGSTPDETTFRVILNRCDGTVEFQYNKVGTHGLDSAALVGMQADSNATSGPNPGWLYINRQTYPYETKPRNDWCIKMYPAVGALVNDGWNMVSVANIPNDLNYAKTHLFPQATSAAFAYTTGYTSQTTLSNGPGYWMKFNGNQQAGGVAGTFNPSVIVNVQDKWNMVGSVSGFVPTASIVPGGGTAIVSPYYGYAGGYNATTSLAPGQGYWVKVNGAGTLQLNASAALPKAPPTVSELGLDGLNTITIRDKNGRAQTLYFGDEKALTRDISYFELPPPPPAGGFDARFSASGRMVETYTRTANQKSDFPIGIQSASYPISVSWNMHSDESGGFELIVGGKSTSISGIGTKVITDAGVNAIIIRVTDGIVPKEFALSQNYPNPFNPSTRFRVDVAATSQVEVAVFDILGRKIATLLNGEKAAGSYSMEWNGQDDQGLNVPTGMYFIRMTAGQFTDSRKVTLLK